MFLLVQKPQTNLDHKQEHHHIRGHRGLPSLYTNEEDLTSDLKERYGRYSGIYTSARGKSAGRTGPLNPIKHWRKQLMPSQGHITGKPTLNSVIWTPGGTSVLHSDIDTSCCGISSSNPKNGMLFSIY